MNSDIFDSFAPSLPNGVLYPFAAATFLLLVFLAARTRDLTFTFVLFAPYMRWLGGLFHEITFMPTPLGMSLNAAISASLFGVGLLVVRKRYFFLKYLIPVYVLALVALISGVANNDLGGFINVVLKYGYLAVTILAIMDVLERLGERRVLGSMLFYYVLVVIAQVLSVVLGVTKAGEADGSVSYIGGYSHESTFSIILGTGLYIACLGRSLNGMFRVAMVFLLTVGIFVANYRTTMLGCAPIIVTFLALGAVGRFKREHRAFVGGVVFCLGLLGFVAISGALQDRFSDLTVAASSDDFIRDPSLFSAADRRLMSGRAYIWSNYIYAYVEGDPKMHVFGAGPEARLNLEGKYAHNTLVSALFEYGPVGVLAIIYLWVAMLFVSLKALEGRAYLVAGHLGFILLNMSTMPMWSIEGNILYGLLCGYTLYQARNGRRQRALTATERANSSEMVAAPFSGARSA